MDRLIAIILTASILCCTKPSRAQSAGSGSAQGPTQSRVTEGSCVADAFTDVITGEDVQRYGLSRLTDVFSYSTQWFSESVSGYHWEAAPADILPDMPPPRVYVDGVPISSRLLGRSHFNALPVSLSDIACIELAAGPASGHRSPSRFGSVRIYTKDPDFGLTLEGSAAAGNEINDPGPFRYTGEGGENVDRIGPHATVGAAVDHRRWNGRMVARTDEYHTTDALLKERVRTIFDDPKPRIQTRSLGAAASAAGQHVLAGITSTRDVAFFEPVGIELPAGHRLLSAGGSGRFVVHDVDVRYAAALSHGELGVRDVGGTGEPAIDLDWAQTDVDAEADVRHRSVRLGAALRGIEIETGQAIADTRVIRTSFYAGVDRRVSATWRQRLLLEWERQDDRSSAAAFASSRLHLTADHAVALAGSFGTVLPDQRGLWMWMGRGYELPGSGSAGISPLEGRTLPRLLTIDAAWNGIIADKFRATVRLLVRDVRHAHQPVFVRAFDPETGGYSVTTGYRGDVFGRTAGVRLGLRHAPTAAFRHRLSYAAERVLDGDDPYRNARSRIPTHRLMYAATFAPVDRFSLSARVLVTAASTWPGYDLPPAAADDAAPLASTDVPHEPAPLASTDAPRKPSPLASADAPEAASPIASPDLGEYVFVDLSAMKRMWEDRLVLSLALGNLLDEPARYHPAGAAFHMTLRFAIQMRLTSTEGFRPD